MKRRNLVFMFRWIIPLSFVIICVFLPDFSYQTYGGKIILPNLLERIFFFIFLSYPFINAAEILSKISDSKRQDYEQFFIKGENRYLLGRIIARFTVTISSFGVMFFTLHLLFSFPVFMQWLVTIIFTISVAMLQWNIDDYLKVKNSFG